MRKGAPLVESGAECYFRNVSTALASAQNRVDSVTIMKLGGAGNIAESTSPAQMDTRHSTLAITMALNGEPARILAVPQA